MIRFQRLTGCRPGEVCILRPCDVDTSGEVWAYRPESHKTEHHGRDRVIFLGPKAQDVLRPYLLRDKTAYCFVPAESERKRNALTAGESANADDALSGEAAAASGIPSGRRAIATRPTVTTGRLPARSIWRIGRSSKGSGEMRRRKSRVCCPTGTRTNCGIAWARKCESNSAWKRRKSCWGTPRPTYRRFTPNVICPWRRKSCGRSDERELTSIGKSLRSIRPIFWPIT